jgi:hypothetical protein
VRQPAADEDKGELAVRDLRQVLLHQEWTAETLAKEGNHSVHRLTRRPLDAQAVAAPTWLDDDMPGGFTGAA